VTRRTTITSVSNARLKQLRELRRRRRERFLVEGYRPVARALARGAPVRELYAAPALYLGEDEDRLVALAASRGAVVHELGPAAFRSVTGRPRPDGLLAVVDRPPTDLRELDLGRSTLLAVAQGIERPGNLGTIVRTCAGAGVDALLVCDTPTDLFHPETVQGSVGTLFDIDVVEASGAEAIAWLHACGVRTVVASPSGDRPYWEAGFRVPTAVVVGSERHGVTDDWLAAADEVVRIPMAGAADSLNVAVAAGIVLFEAARRLRPTDDAAAASARRRRRVGSAAAPPGRAAATQGSAVPDRPPRAAAAPDPAGR
jgi:TrmH family RNA methyltransferase